MANSLKEAIQIAKTKPNDPNSIKLLEGLKAGKFDQMAASEGIDLSKFKAKNTPVGQSSTKIPSVAEREGWIPKLGQTIGAVAKALPSAMKDYAQQTGLADKKPGERVTAPMETYWTDEKLAIDKERADLRQQIDSLPESSTHRQALEGQLNRSFKKEEGRLPMQRVAGAAKGVFDAAKEGIGNFTESLKRGAEGSDLYNIGKEGVKRQSKLLDLLDESFNSGKMDQLEYNRLKNQIEGSIDKAENLKNTGRNQTFEGVTGAAKGISETIVSPITGSIGGAFKPEFNALGEKIAGNENASRAVQYLSDKWDNLDPNLQNSLSTVLNLAGLGVTKSTAKGIAKSSTVQTLKQGAKNTALDFAKAAPGVADDLGRGLKVAAGKFKGTADDIVAAGKNKKIAKNISSADELLRPLPTQKNIQEALASKVNVKLGEKKLFSGSKDVIDLSPRMKRASETLAKYFPDLKKTKVEILPIKIDEKISEIAKPLSEKFKSIPVSTKTKEKMTKVWEKVKRSQADDPNFSLGVDKMQNNFEENYLNQLTKNFKSADGKYRQPNADDVWEIAKAYDKSIKPSIKNATEASSANFQVQKEAWLENRKVLRDIMEDLAKTTDDPGVKQAFMEMSDLYESTTQIIKNARPTNKSGTSKIGDFAREYKKQAVAGALGVYGINKLLD